MNKRNHGYAKARTKAYRSWEAAKYRCYNKNCKKYPRYGGRGIKMSEEWKNDFLAFLSDMGECPEGCTLGRINNDGDYTKENCRWETLAEQSSNRSDNVFFTHNGLTLTASEWGRRLGVCYNTLIIRASKGLPIEKILCPIKYKEHQGPRPYRKTAREKLLREMIRD
jgi:hypothetical protein